MVCSTRDLQTLDQDSPLILCDNHQEKVGEVWSKSIRDLPPAFQPGRQHTSKPDFSDTLPLVQDLSLPPLESSSPEKPRKALLPTPKPRKALLPTPRPPAPQAEPRNALLEQNSLELMEMMRQWCINLLMMLRERYGEASDGGHSGR